MLSAIERGVKAPTVLVLDRVATGLDTSLARLLGAETPARLILLRRHDQKVARDPSGWERRILSPMLPGVEFEFMRTTLGPKVNAGVFLPHAHGSREHAVESGTLRLTIDGTPTPSAPAIPSITTAIVCTPSRIRAMRPASTPPWTSRAMRRVRNTAERNPMIEGRDRWAWSPDEIDVSAIA